MSNAINTRDNTEKAELLKDILAFANAWKSTDAYILIGVEEVYKKPAYEVHDE